MLHLLVTLGAFATATPAAAGTVTVGGYVPSACRAGDPLVYAAGALPGSSDRNCTLAAVVSTRAEDQIGDDTVIRITVTPR